MLNSNSYDKLICSWFLLFLQNELYKNNSFWTNTAQVAVLAQDAFCNSLDTDKALVDPLRRLTWLCSLQATTGHPAEWTSLEAPAFATSSWRK